MAELAEAALQRSADTGASGFVGGGGPGRGTVDLPPTPELIEGVRNLPPALDQPRLSDVDVTAPDPGFRLSRLLRPVRWPLIAVIGLVAADALASIALPGLYQFGVDHGIRPGVLSMVWLAAGIGALIIAADWVIVRGDARLTARVGETVLLTLLSLGCPPQAIILVSGNSVTSMREDLPSSCPSSTVRLISEIG